MSVSKVLTSSASDRAMSHEIFTGVKKQPVGGSGEYHKIIIYLYSLKRKLGVEWFYFGLSMDLDKTKCHLLAWRYITANTHYY